MYQTLTNMSHTSDTAAGEGARLVRGDATNKVIWMQLVKKKSARCRRKVKGRKLPRWHWRLLALRHGWKLFTLDEDFRPTARLFKTCGRVQGQKSVQGLSKKNCRTAKCSRTRAGCSTFSCQSRCWDWCRLQGTNGQNAVISETICLFPQSEDWILEPEGWASKGVTPLKTKHVRFTREQGDFLKKKIDEGTNGGHKIREHDTHQ